MCLARSSKAVDHHNATRDALGEGRKIIPCPDREVGADSFDNAGAGVEEVVAFGHKKAIGPNIAQLEKFLFWGAVIKRQEVEPITQENAGPDFLAVRTGRSQVAEHGKSSILLTLDGERVGLRACEPTDGFELPFVNGMIRAQTCCILRCTVLIF